MPTVRLGNKAAIDTTTGRVLDLPQVTTMVLHDDTHEERMRTATHSDGLWSRVAAAPPAWVESDDKELEEALAEHFGCSIGQPE